MDNPQNQGISNGETLVSFRNGRELSIVPIKERTDETTGNIIPAHKALCFFVAQRNADGSKKLGANGKALPVQGSVEWVAFSSKLGELTPAELSARKDELQVVTLEESGNKVLCVNRSNGLDGEEVEEF